MRKNFFKKYNRGYLSARITLAVIIVTLVFVAAACGKTGSGAATEPITREEFCLDTICNISIYEMKDEAGEAKSARDMESEANAAIDEAFRICGELEDKLSRTRKTSDISRLNAAEGEWTEVGDDTLSIIKKGIDYAELSGGDFDISCGSITEAWDFHAAEGKEKLPDEEDLTEAVKHIDFNGIEIEGSKVRLKDPETQIDLGGIAKGYIGDRMTESLEASGVTSAIINLGGNVICIGGKPKGGEPEDFVIGVETPFSDRTEIIGKVKVRDKTLVTSGVYERKIEVGGKLYHHILDTKTGYPAETDLDAVTLVADKGRSADIDALSTICLIKGSEKAMKLIEQTDGVEGVFILKDGSVKQTSTIMSSE
ncbi:MAG: FAD:protein FMN transferase [Mogibacterium sp.]|nr:FAD:protein FMN transferase [Mogibacterium sp.]